MEKWTELVNGQVTGRGHVKVKVKVWETVPPWKDVRKVPPKPVLANEL